MSSKNHKDNRPVVIDVRNVKKKFKIYYDGSNNLKDRVLFRNRRKHEVHWVLKGISFQIHQGEAVGLIGQNGCGKSTTLKMLTRILYPDEGTISVKGRVSSLIELGAGFHPDLSGRENIYTNASIFGLNRKEIDRRLEEIIAFSELEEYIDNPVRTYSSGMYTRLAFAVAINVDADILLIDEILAVGDAAFQAKCFTKLQEIKAKGTTIVIVSHSLGQIEQICERSIWIDKGKIRMIGSPREVHPYYVEYMSEKNQKLASKEASSAAQKTEKPAKKEPENKESAQPKEEKKEQKKQQPEAEAARRRWGTGEAKIGSIHIVDREGNPKKIFRPDEPVRIVFSYRAEKELPNAVIGIAIYRSDQVHLYGTNTLIDTSQPVSLKKEGQVELYFNSLPVENGRYTIDLALHKPDGFNYDFWREACSISVAARIPTPGMIWLQHEWILDGEPVIAGKAANDKEKS